MYQLLKQIALSVIQPLAQIRKMKMKPQAAMMLTQLSKRLR